MKGAVVIGESREVLESLRSRLVAAGATESPRKLELLHDDGYLFNVFTEPEATADIPWREGVRAADSLLRKPDLDSACAWWVECRSESVFVNDLRTAVADVPGQVWVLDGNDVLWQAEAIDPRRILL